GGWDPGRRGSSPRRRTLSSELARLRGRVAPEGALDDGQGHAGGPARHAVVDDAAAVAALRTTGGQRGQRAHQAALQAFEAAHVGLGASSVWGWLSVGTRPGAVCRAGTTRRVTCGLRVVPSSRTGRPR